MNTRPLVALIRKDLQLHLGDRRALLLTIAAPIAIASFFGSLFGGTTGQSKPSGIPIEIVDLDRSPISTEIASNLAGEASLKTWLVDEQTARRDVAEGRAAAAVILPANFGLESEQSFFRPGTKPEILLLRDPSRSIESGMVEGLLTKHVMESVTRRVFSPEDGRQRAKEALTNLFSGSANFLPTARREALSNLLSSVDRWMGVMPTNSAGGTGGGGFGEPFRVRQEEQVKRAGQGPRMYNGYAHSFGGMGVQFILMAGIDWGVLVLMERQKGLWGRLRAAPISRGTLLAGRAASGAIIAFGTLAICWVFSMAVFGVRVRGSWAGFVACNAAFSLFAATFGLCIAAVGRTPQATRGIAILAVLLMVMMGGAWVPSFIFPAWLQKAGVLIPARWAVDGFDAMTWRGLDYHAALAPVGVLLGCSALLAWLSCRWFKWERD